MLKSSLLALASCLFCVSASQAADTLSSAAPFSLSPKQLLDDANSPDTQKTNDAVILLNEEHYEFKPDGKLHHTVHSVFQVLTQQGVSEWSASRFSWEPWREERPKIKARTITADGAQHDLDPATISDSPAGPAGPDEFSDMRIINCPLPALAVGAVVEQFVDNDETPVFGSVTSRLFLVSNVPERLVRIVFDFPSTLPFRYKIVLANDVKEGREQAGQQKHIVLERRKVDAAEPELPLLPGDAPRFASVVFSTSPSWQALASQYSDIVDKQIAGSKLDAIKASIPANATREQTIAALVQKLQDDIRYTGIEFGQAAVIPNHPEEVLRRGYGDCKDKASLLVAMLRAADIPANVALLDAGFEQDVDPDFPGMGMFNHAIVVIPGPTRDKDIWIDATATYSHPGILPGPDQGRLALIASKNTTKLTPTPESAPADSVEIDTHEYFLPEYGPTKIVETSEGTGNLDAALRGGTGPIDNENSKRNVQEYLQKNYDTKSDIVFEHTKPEDLTTPFHVRLTIPDSRNVLVGESGAEIPVSTAMMLNNLPRYFLVDDSEHPRKYNRQRTEDFLVPQAFIAKNVYKIHLPSGYVLKKLPADQDEKLGPVHLTAHFEDNKEVIVATVKLDTGKRRYTLAEGEALKKAAIAYEKTPPQTILIQPRGQADLDAGRIGDAISDFRQLATNVPAQPLYRDQAARALLAAGAGEEARAEARKATEIAPQSVIAWKNLGYILSRDVVGREYKLGWDPQGAEAAYRKAIALDKDDLEAKHGLVSLLEYDARGERYTDPKRLDAALDIYHRLTEEQLSQDRFLNIYIYATLYANKLDELSSRLDKLPINNETLALRAVVTAVQKTPEAAIADVQKAASSADERTAILGRAGAILSYMRNYSAAGALLEAGAAGASDSAQMIARASALKKVKAVDCPTIQPDSPENAVRASMCAEIFSDFDKQLALFAPGAFGKMGRAEFIEARERNAGIPSEQGADRANMADWAISNAELSVDDNGNGGYRVKQSVPGGATQTTFIVRDGAKFEILGHSAMVEGVGRRALAELAKGQGESARKWLNWLRDNVKAENGDDPLAGSIFPRLWIKNMKATDAQVKLAAASLLALSPDAAEVLPIFREAAAHDTNDPKRDYIDLAYVWAANSAHKPTEAIVTAKALLQRHPESNAAHIAAINLLAFAKRGPEAERVAKDWLASDADNIEAMRAYKEALQLQSKFTEAEAELKKITASQNANPADWNDLGWTALLAGDLTPEKLDAVQHGIATVNAPDILHTLAAMYAESGKGAQAREELMAAMNGWGLAQPNTECWYVFGRIAELYGLKDTARAYYAHLKPPVDPRQENMSTYALAQRRLAVLNGGPQLASNTR